VKRRRYLTGLAALGLLGTAGYAATRDRSTLLPGDGTAETPAPTPGERRSPTPTDTPTATDTPTVTPSAERTKTVGGVALTVSRPVVESTLSFDGEDRTADDGSTFLLVELIAENVGEEPANHPRDFTVEHGDGTEFEVFRESDVDGTKAASPERPLYGGSGAFWPGATETGWVFAEVPADASTVAFVWRYRHDGTSESNGEKTVWRLRVPA